MKIRNCNMYEFLENLGGKKIICFGKGLQLNSMINMYDHPLGWDKGIKYIVDNDKYLWDCDCVVNEYTFQIYNPEILKTECLKDVVLVIFSQRCYEIIQQLNEIEELNELECYAFPIMQTYTNIDKHGFCGSLKEAKIPKKIHYCWFGNNPLSDSAKACIESWKKYCPDYEIICWNETNYDVNKHAYTREAYKHKAYAFVSDYARLEILYENGGIYMDVDVEVRKNLDPLLNNEAYCAFSNHVPRINTGLGFGAVKGFTMLKEMLEAYRFERYETDYGFNKTLCQSYNTKVLVYHGLKQNGQYQVVNGMTCYPKDYFDPMSSYFYIAPNVDKAFSVHHSANTWSHQNMRFRKIKEDSKLDIYKVLDMIVEKS